MVIKVGINGFGRIGRVISRVCLKNSDLQLSAINDPAINTEYISYLIKFDSTHGKLNGNITYTDDEVIIDGEHIKVFHEKLPQSVPWHAAGVQYVVEASGMFTSLHKASGHLTSDGVKRVIITAPSSDVPMIILGVNENNLSIEQKVLSCASSTLYCLAPIIKVLDDQFGVNEGFITSIHAMTPSLKPLDGLCLRGKHWRDHRSIHQNIIPATTGACKALGKIIPSMKDKLTGLAFRVPIVNVSVLDLTIRLDTKTSLPEIIKSVERASKNRMQNIIKISDEESVSSDFIGESYSCIFDAASSIQLKPNFFKIICWYENEYSYACRVADAILLSEKQLRLEFPLKLKPKLQLKSRSSIKHDETQQTDCYKKEISVTCDCNSGKFTCSSAQEIQEKENKAPRHFTKKSSIETLTSSSYNKPKIQLFKIWNDSQDITKPVVKSKTSSFFQSCLTSTTSKQPQTRLENVKREFSKMINITEDLLKKTHSNQSDINPTPKNQFINKSDLQFRPMDKYFIADTEMYKKTDRKTTENCGDCKSPTGTSKNTIDVLNDSNDEETVSYYSFEKERSDIALSDKKNTEVKQGVFNMRESTKSSREPSLNLIKIKTKENIVDNSAVIQPSTDFKEQLAKTIGTLIEGLTKNNRLSLKENNTPSMSLVSHTSIDDNNVQERTTLKQKQNDSAFKEDQKFNLFEKYKMNNNTNLKIFDEELKKRNIELVDRNFVGETMSETNMYFDRTAEEVEPKRNIKQPILEDIKLYNESIGVASEGTSRCESPDTYTTISNRNENKRDIYDKLDSASATDSNNSFEINEKKSQVINITDLTSSIEDLARLDKICRIIEISDELSNKLFSSLDDTEYDELNMTKWSFKDLCEKIHLDEFCNKVFGNRSV